MKKSISRPKTNLQENLRRAAKTIRDKMSGGGAYPDGDTIGLNGKYLAETGETIGYPGTANRTRYVLLNDGVFKVDFFMSEEDTTLRNQTAYTFEEFASYLRNQGGRELIGEISKSVKDILKLKRTSRS